MTQTKKELLITGTSLGIGVEIVPIAIGIGVNALANSGKVKSRKKRIGISANTILPMEVNLISKERISAAVKHRRISEAMAKEISLFELKVADAEPSYFKTNFLNSDSSVLPAKKLRDYNEVTETIRMNTQKIIGSQPGNPQKLAPVIYQLSKMNIPP